MSSHPCNPSSIPIDSFFMLLQKKNFSFLLCFLFYVLSSSLSCHLDESNDCNYFGIRLNYASATGFAAFLTPVGALAELNLASNELPWLADRLFTATPHLSVLDLSGCNIRNISTFAFQVFYLFYCSKISCHAK